MPERSELSWARCVLGREVNEREASQTPHAIAAMPIAAVRFHACEFIGRRSAYLAVALAWFEKALSTPLLFTTVTT